MLKSQNLFSWICKICTEEDFLLIQDMHYSILKMPCLPLLSLLRVKFDPWQCHTWFSCGDRWRCLCGQIWDRLLEFFLYIERHPYSLNNRQMWLAVSWNSIRPQIWISCAFVVILFHKFHSWPHLYLDMHPLTCKDCFQSSNAELQDHPLKNDKRDNWKGKANQFLAQRVI